MSFSTTPEDVVFLIFEELPIEDILSIRACSRGCNLIVVEYLKFTWSPNKLVAPLLSTTSASFVSLIHRIGGLITGPRVLDVLLRLSYDKPLLEVIVHINHQDTIFNWLTTNNFNRTRVSYPSWDANLTSVLSVVAIQLLGTKRMYIIFTRNAPLRYILDVYPTSLMNFSDGTNIYCLYPRLTLIHRAAIGLGRRKMCVKYSQHGAIRACHTQTFHIIDISQHAVYRFWEGVRYVGDDDCLIWGPMGPNKQCGTLLHQAWLVRGIPLDKSGSRRGFWTLQFEDFAHTLLNEPIVVPKAFSLNWPINLLDITDPQSLNDIIKEYVENFDNGKLI